MGNSRRNPSEYALYQLEKNFNVNSQGSVHSRICSSKNSSDEICLLDEKLIPQLVEQIIYEKFMGTLARINEKSLERRRTKRKYFQNSNEEVVDILNKSEDSGSNESSSEESSTNTSAGSTEENRYQKSISSQPSPPLGTNQTRNIPSFFKVS